MPKGVYAAASSMLADRLGIEVRANNLANVQSTGFRRSIPLRDSFAQALAKEQGRQGGLETDGGAGAFHENSYRVWTDGTREQTRSPLDTSLVGPGFFVVHKGAQTLLTRQGHFGLDDQSRLITDDGLPVQGQGGAITIPPEATDINIDTQGRIYAVVPSDAGPQRAFLDQIRIVDVENAQAMKPLTGQRFDPGQQQLRDVPNAHVEQGWIEGSNVQPINEMVEMLAAQRRYDAAQKVLTRQIDADRRTSELLGGAS